MDKTNDKNGLVKANTKAYGYSYTSLSDIVDQGYKLPKMRTGTDNGKDYVYYYDEELKDWIRGAEIVVPDMKGSNSAQRYGSALSYSRRYSAMLCLGLASRDDEKLETQEPKNETASLGTLVNEFRQLYTEEEQLRILNGLHLTKIQDIGTHDLQKYVNFKKHGQK